MLIAIRAKQTEHYCIANDFTVPYMVLEACRTSMKRVRAIVDGELIVFSIDAELTQGYTVCKASGSLSCTWAIAHVVGKIGITKSYIVEFSITVGHAYGSHTSSKALQFDVCAACIGKFIRCYYTMRCSNTI